MSDFFNKTAFSHKVLSAVLSSGSYRRAARESGVSPAALNKIARGEMLPGIENFFRLMRWMTGKVPPQ